MPALRESLRREWQQFRELSRLFFGRFFDNDLICLDGDTRATLVGIFALLAAPSLFLPMLEFLQFGSFPLCFKPWYIRDLAALPDRRDCAVLRPLPVRLSTLFAAKIAALARFWLLFTVAVIAVQGLLMNALGWRRFQRYAPYAQFALVTALLLATPPLWFVGLYQSELGWTQPLFRELAGQARTALWIAAAAAGIGYLLSYRRSVSKAFEGSEGPAAAPGPVARLLTAIANRALLRTPAERAAFHFVWQTTMRSRSHRVLVATWAAAGFALVFQSLAGVMASGNRTWWQNPQGVLLPAPLVLSVFLLTGLRYAFTVPAELRANWLFQVAGSSEPGEYLAGMRKAAALIGVAPLFALLLPAHVALWGWTMGGLHILYGATVAYLLLEALLVGLDKLERPLLFLPFLACAAAVKVGLDRYRRRLLADEFALVFDERPDPVIRTLELQQ